MNEYQIVSLISLFGFLILGIRWMTVGSGVLTVILVIIASRVEPKGVEDAASA